MNYLFMVAKELRIIMAQLGLRCVNEMIGRVDLLQTDKALAHWKAKGLDLSAIIAPAQQPDEFLGSYAIHDQDHELDKALDNKLIPLAEPASNRARKSTRSYPCSTPTVWSAPCCQTRSLPMSAQKCCPMTLSTLSSTAVPARA